MSRVVAAVALFLASVLAGCASDPSADSEPEPEPEAFDDVEVTATTGAIRGIVVSEAIVPIPDVLVALTDGRNQTTDEEGAFVFNGLEPGDYFLTASKLGYLGQQAAATVVAGDEQPPITKIMLPADQASMPYAVVQQWDGFLQCGFTVVVLGVNACGLIDDRFIKFFDMPTPPLFAQAEMVWESTQTLSPDLNLGFYQGGTTNFNSVQGPSPLVTNTTGEEIVERRGNESTELPMRVFPPYTLPVGLTLNQQYIVYLTMFYGFQPRPDWLFIVDGPCDPYTDCV